MPMSPCRPRYRERDAAESPTFMDMLLPTTSLATDISPSDIRYFRPHCSSGTRRSVYSRRPTCQQWSLRLAVQSDSVRQVRVRHHPPHRTHPSPALVPFLPPNSPVVGHGLRSSHAHVYRRSPYPPRQRRSLASCPFMDDLCMLCRRPRSTSAVPRRERYTTIYIPHWLPSALSLLHPNSSVMVFVARTFATIIGLPFARIVCDRDVVS
ncbi:hypothetical protein C8F01DRAFT_689629 [Mycena amicta]|nr:hypothetical protein C8F01DRAFT_138673 [Mycena amicta]KAJ7050280.1 hypothetical protein C8F01DRAFT_689629 [Mycena amicta]